MSDLGSGISQSASEVGFQEGDGLPSQRDTDETVRLLEARTTAEPPWMSFVAHVLLASVALLLPTP